MNSFKGLAGLTLLALMQAACSPGMDLKDLGAAQGESSWASSVAGFDRALSGAPARLQSMSGNLQNNLSAARADRPTGCQVATADAGSTAKAINEILKAADGAPVSICAEPGPLDEEIILTNNANLFFSAGVYEQTKTIHFKGNRTAVVGATAFGTILNMSAPGPQFMIGHFTDYYRIANLSLIRTQKNPGVGDDGIRSGSSNNNGTIESLWIEKQHDGMYLGVTAYTQVRDLTINESVRHGILFTNNQGAGPVQYYMRDVLFTRNGGFAIYASPDKGQMSVGSWDGIYTFHNGRGGIVFTTANGNKVESLRLTNSFFGNDGHLGSGAEIALHGGSLHSISNTFIEMSGFSGLEMEKIAENSPGIYISEGVNTVNMTGLMIVNSSGPGILNAGKNVLVSGSTLANNGHRGSDDRKRSAIHNLASGTMTLSGNQFPAIGEVQRVAIYNDGGVGSVIETGNRFETSGGMTAMIGVGNNNPTTTLPAPGYSSNIKAQFDAYLPGCWTMEKEQIWQAWFNNGGTQTDFVNTLNQVRTTNPACLIR